MEASDARKLTTDSRNISLDRFYAAIKAAAQAGDSSVTLTVHANEAKFAPEIVKRLIASGYKVEHNTGYDQRDGDSWNSININWT